MQSQFGRTFVDAAKTGAGAAAGHLVPKLRLGTQAWKLRFPCRGNGHPRRDETGNRVSRECVPKRSLGTRCRNEVPEMAGTRHQRPCGLLRTNRLNNSSRRADLDKE